MRNDTNNSPSGLEQPSYAPKRPISKLTAKRVENNEFIYASQVTKADGPFYCPNTFEQLIVRKCKEKADHFAYHARKSAVGGLESDLHKACKRELLAALQLAYPTGSWEEERETFTEDKTKGYTKVRPDLSGRIGDKNGKGLIIEVQASALSLDTILHRTAQYSKRNAYILWVVPLREELGTANFRPRLFERFLHSMYYGRVYHWYIGNGSKLIPVHYGTAKRYIEINTWREDGAERTEGGYYKDYLRIKKPEYGKPLDLITDFKPENRNSFELENEKMSVPACKIYMDKQSVWWEKKKIS